MAGRYGYGGSSYKELSRAAREGIRGGNTFSNIYGTGGGGGGGGGGPQDYLAGPSGKRSLDDYIAPRRGGGGASNRDAMDEEIRELLKDGNNEEANRRIQEYMERFANEESEAAPVMSKRKWAKPEDRPMILHGRVVPKQDALLMQLVLNNKATLKAQLDVSKQPIVGLDHVVEYIDPEGVAPRIYHCTLCNTYRSVSTVMEHLTGYKHRVLYIRLHYPNQARTYLLPDGRTANRIGPLMKLASIRCSELELVYGRGDFLTKHERPQVDPEELESKESDLIVNEGEMTEALRKIAKTLSGAKLECDEDIALSKAIINTLTDAIIEYRNKPM